MKFLLNDVESGILVFRIQIGLRNSGIQLKVGIWNPSSTDMNLEAIPGDLESTAWNTKSKAVFDYL